MGGRKSAVVMSFSKIFLFRIATHVLEGQHGDGRLVRQRERLARPQ
jgi:hypothetical protein